MGHGVEFSIVGFLAGVHLFIPHLSKQQSITILPGVRDQKKKKNYHVVSSVVLRYKTSWEISKTDHLEHHYSCHLIMSYSTSCLDTSCSFFILAWSPHARTVVPSTFSSACMKGSVEATSRLLSCPSSCYNC